MLAVAEAETLILEAAQPLQVEWVDLPQALNRVLAAAIHSPVDIPAQATSSMDGYAVRSQDVQDSPVALQVVETVPAGSIPERALSVGEATRLYTGSILPQGADAIVIQENTERLHPDQVQILQSVPPDQFVRQVGQYCLQGQELLSPGLRLKGPEIAVLSAVQRFTIPVFRQPRVAILSTGNELVPIDHPLQPGQIVDSNQYGLSALVQAAGGIPIRQGIAVDDPDSLRQSIQQALQVADVVLSTGGVSVGDFDFVDSLLEELGGTIHIRKVAIKPGKPLTVATFPRGSGSPLLYFGLPGNPVSAMVTFWRFVHPALNKLQGQSSPWGPTFVQGISDQPLSSDGQRESYLWGRLHWSEGVAIFTPVSNYHSANLVNLAGCNALAVLAVGTQQIPVGAPLSIMLIPE